MKRKNRWLALFLVSSFLTTVNAREFKASYFSNDKQARNTVMDKWGTNDILDKYPDDSFRRNVVSRFYEAFSRWDELTNSRSRRGKKRCDMDFARVLDEQFHYTQYGETADSVDGHLFNDYLKIARVENGIDDIFYEIILNTTHDYRLLAQADRIQMSVDEIILSKSRKPNKAWKVAFGKDDRGFDYNPSMNATVELNRLKLPKLYKRFDKWPDGISTCLYDAYSQLIKDIKFANGNNKLRDLMAMHEQAALDNLITENVLHRLVAMTKFKSYSNPLFVRSYFDTIQKSKNILVPDTVEREEFLLPELELDFASEFVDEEKTVTRRKAFLTKYTQTQIIMLSNILRNMVRRMGADPDYNLSSAQIVLSFTYEGNVSERKNYVETYDLSMQDQYSLARNLLRKDLRVTNAMDIFKGVNIKYDDVIMAALETGYIDHNDINQVLMYDDIFTTKELTSWQKAKKYFFHVLKVSTLYIAPPWSILGSIAIVVIENQFNKNKNDGARHENENALIR